MDMDITFARSSLDLEQVKDLRRSVLCGELNWPRELVEEAPDSSALLALATLGAKAIATARLVKREGVWHLELLAVLGRFRRLGVGGRLVEALEIRARQEGATQLRVLAPGATGFYFVKLGYKPVNEAELEKLLKLNYGEAESKPL